MPGADTDTVYGNQTFGGGLQDFGGGATAGPTDSGADVPPVSLQAPPASAPSEAPAAPDAPSKGGIFGSGIGSTFGGPRYNPPDPQASALDQTADTLTQRIARANKVATDPMLQFFNPEGVQKARDFVPTATEQLQKIKAQKAGMQANRTQAETLGLAPGEVPDEASDADRLQAATAGALKGDLKKFQGIAAVNPQAAAAIQDRVYEVVSGHLTNAQFAFDKLSNMHSEGEYNAAVKSLRADGTITDLEALGMKVPASFDQFNAGKGAEGKALREAKIGSEALRAKLEERAGGDPMEKKEADTYATRLTTQSGQPLNNVTWSRINGKRVAVANGMANINDLGDKFNFASPDQRKALHEDTKAAVEDKEIEKFRSFNRTRSLAVTDEKGNFIPPEGALNAKGQRVFMNTNPNVQQGVAEGLASMLRGGTGGATSGLLNIETGKRGAVQAVLDKIITNYAGGINTLTGDQVKPYLSQLTQEQQRAVMDGLQSYSGKSIADRVAPIATRAGELGLDASALGLGKNEIAGVDAALKAGRDSTINRFAPRARSTSGGDGGIYLDNPPPMLVTQPDHPPGSVPPVPPPVQPQSQTPPPASPPGSGAPPVTPGPTAPPSPGGPAGGGTPPGVQPAPGSPAPGGGPGGGPAPVQPAPMTIAGQSVSVPLPPGAGPNLVSNLQRVETGNVKNPWTAEAGKGPDGRPLSSASGAFQMIDKTWNDNKPAGAPNRAKDATAAQQSQAFATLIAKNAQSLTAAGLPVNDTSLYIAHNLGAAGAGTLLKADPNADARTVVGEVAARNNPTFFKGKPTVATVMQRYQAEMSKEPPRLPPTSKMPDTGDLSAMAGPGDAETFSPENMAQMTRNAAAVAPAAGSTIGAVAGAVAGGGVGGFAGGAAGGAAGQAASDYLLGKDQSPAAIAKQAALGGVLGIAPAARLVGAAARVGGVAGVEAGAKALEGGDTADVIGAGVEGGAYALGGEALGRFISSLGPAAHKVLSNYLPSAQKEMSAQAGKLSEARKVLETEQPKLAGEGAGPNPKYEAAKETEAKASEYIKSHGQSPDDMAYAYDQTKAGTSAGEAAVMRKATAEKGAVSEGYDDLRQQVTDTGVGKVKPNQAVPDGPVSQLRTADNPTGKVPEAFRADAEHAEMLVKAPAKNFGEKWQQLQDAGSELIKKRLSFLANNDKPSADAMNNLFEGVRNQQRAVAEHVFGAERGATVIKNLESLDTRYAKVMNATGGMSYKKMQDILAAGNTPARRDLEKNFADFAKGDPSALRAFNAMKAGARGDWKTEAALMGPVIAGEVAANLHGVPTVGLISAAVGGHRLYKMVQGYMNARVLGKAVTFKDFLANEMKTTGAAGAAATAAQRGAVMQ